MSFFDAVRQRVGGTSTRVLLECRHCGWVPDQTDVECPNCGRSEIARYEFR